MREAISRVIRSLFTRNRGEIETMMKMSRNDRWRSSLVFFFSFNSYLDFFDFSHIHINYLFGLIFFMKFLKN